MDDAVLARLRALGGDWTGEISPWGSYEIVTPRGDAWPVVWMPLETLDQEIARWEAGDIRGQRLRTALRAVSGTMD